MKNIKNNAEGKLSESGEKDQLKKLLVFAAVGLKLARQIQVQLQEVEDSVEIIAREVARQVEKQDDLEASRGE